MSLKSELRKELMLKRKCIYNKTEKDEAIAERLLNLDLFKSANTVLFYAALADEINIDSVIGSVLNSGKKVALPKCINSHGDMRFYYINSLNDIKEATFGVREPDVVKENEVIDFSSSICIVPGIAFDTKGFRLGYGKGYYDRFLLNYPFISVGLCYNELVKKSLPIDEYDLPVNVLITEDEIFYIDID